MPTRLVILHVLQLINRKSISKKFEKNYFFALLSLIKLCSNSAPKQVKTWIIPADFDHAEAESRHLIYEADTDADHKLTKDEILEKYDIFVGSQATDFGEALTRHDEF